MRPSWLAGAVLGASFWAGGCATNPVTGETELALISESQEIAMGQQAAAQVEASIGVVDDADLNAYVQRIGESLARDSERPNLPWRFRVVDDPTPNAFALPGGFIYVTRGMLSLMNSEAELAAVLGHEVGHVTARHSVHMLSQQQLAQIGLVAGMIFVPELAQFGDLAGQGLGLLFLKYGRDAERQADELGFRYALADNYDVREMADVFAALARSSELAGQSPLPTWLSSHPGPAERIERINVMLAEQPGSWDSRMLGTTPYFRQIDGLIYGNNPRHGFFRGTTFLHPELRFRLEFPQGFQLANLTSAVQAVSERQDAAIQFTFAEGSASQAASAFAQQQGVRTGQASRERINGFQAIVVPFEAQAQGGNVAGYVTYIEDGQRTYQLLTYAAAQSFRSYDNAFRATIGSYARVDDPAVLNVQPERIDAVELSSAMTFNEFLQRNASEIPAQ
ncbi:MAG: M48 family metalloprotease, partial [Longimicrobiales bacterium]